MEEYKSIDISKLVVNPNNPRKHFTEQSIDELAASLKDVGLIEPLVVRPGKGGSLYEIICGERRYRAAVRAGIKNLSCSIRDLNDDQAFDIMISENLKREDISPLDEAEAFNNLMLKRQSTLDDLAIKFGKSTDYIFGRLRLLALIDEGKNYLEDGVIPVTAAIKISALPAKQQVEAFSRLVVPITVSGEQKKIFAGLRELKSYFDNSVFMNLSGADFDITDASLVQEAGSCKTCMKRSGNSLFGDIADNDKCLDAVCYSNKHVQHYQSLATKLAAKLKVEVGYAARAYGSERHLKELGSVYPFGEYQVVSDKQAKVEKNCKYVVFVGVSSVKSETLHGWVKVKSSTVKKQAEKKPKVVDKAAKEAAEREVMIDALYKLKRFENYCDSKGKIDTRNEFCTWLFFQIESANQVILEFINRNGLSVKANVFNGKTYDDVVLNKKFKLSESHFPFSFEYKDVFAMFKKHTGQKVKLIEEMAFLVIGDEIKMNEAKLRKEAEEEVDQLLKSK
jgi:ParB/RepB/Spo0J family partition protein